MEESKKYTVEEVLQITIDILSRIMVPAVYAEQIGKPILLAIGNLKECAKACKGVEKDG